MLKTKVAAKKAEKDNELLEQIANYKNKITNLKKEHKKEMAGIIEKFKRWKVEYKDNHVGELQLLQIPKEPERGARN